MKGVYQNQRRFLVFGQLSSEAGGPAGASRKIGSQNDCFHGLKRVRPDYEKPGRPGR
jgi:hypothetical protein